MQEKDQEKTLGMQAACKRTSRDNRGRPVDQSRANPGSIQALVILDASRGYSGLSQEKRGTCRF